MDTRRYDRCEESGRYGQPGQKALDGQLGESGRYGQPGQKALDGQLGELRQDERRGEMRNVTGMAVRSSEQVRRVRINGGQGHAMRWGDKMFVRLIQGSRVLAEYVTTQVSDLTELVGDLRSRVRGQRGLVRMVVRNASEGWSMTRPLMLYADRRRMEEPLWSEPARRTMLFPWETH